MLSFIPHSFSPGSCNSPKWFNANCAKAVNDKDRCFKIFKADLSDENYASYKVARNLCSSVVDSAKKEFMDKITSKLASCPSGSRAFWSLSKAVCNNFCSSSFPPISDPSGVSINDPFEKANIFAKTFAENSTLPSVATPPLIPSVPSSSMRALKISTRVIRHHDRPLDTSKATGPDDIPSVVLKMCAFELAPVLCRLFKLCLKSGECPSSWKSAHVVPVPKKGDRTNPSNYRPIAITPIMCKVFESIVSDSMLSFLQTQSFLSDHQYGFQKCRSVADLLSFVCNLWAQTLDRFGESVAVALDISKAFDRVWHDALINKLRSIGIHPSLVSWIENFLSERSIAVRVDGVLSDFHAVNSGVPQGCVLSPLLFLVFINDLLSCSDNRLHSFADDSTLHSSISYSSQARCNKDLHEDRISQQLSMNSDIFSILNWGSANRVDFNNRKTQAIRFSLKHQQNAFSLNMAGSDLSFADSISLLGVTVNQDLSWKSHVQQVAKNASRRLGILFRARRYFSPAQLLTLYKSQVRPIMEYCCHVWAGASSVDLSILDRIQRKAIRLVDCPVLSASLQSLAHRRAVSCLSLFYRYYHGRCSAELALAVPVPRTFSRSTRAASSNNPYSVSVPRCRTEVYKSSFFPRTAVLWNKLSLRSFPLSFDLQRFKVNVNRLDLCSL